MFLLYIYIYVYSKKGMCVVLFKNKSRLYNIIIKKWSKKKI